MGLGFGSVAIGGATERGVTGSIRDIGAATAIGRVRFGGTGLIVVFGVVVVLVFARALAFNWVLAFEAPLVAALRAVVTVLLSRFAFGAGLTATFFLRAEAALASGLGLLFAAFFELAFLLPARWARDAVVFLAGARAAFARFAFLPVGAVRWGACLAALRRTTGTRLLMVSGFQRERLCRGLRANRCLWRNRRNRRAIRYHPLLTDETKCYGYFEQVVKCSGVQHEQVTRYGFLLLRAGGFSAR